MVSYYGYDVIRSSWSSHFWVKMHVFSTSFSNKSKACGWNDTKGLFMWYFTCEARKLQFIAALIWFLILDQIQNGGQDGDHCCRCQRPPAAPPPIKYTSSCWEDQRLSTKGKIVLKYCNISKWNTATYQNLCGRVPSTRPPPPSYHGGVWIYVYVRGLSCKYGSSPLSLCLFLFLLLYSFNFLLKFTKINQHSVAGSIRLLRSIRDVAIHEFRLYPRIVEYL